MFLNLTPYTDSLTERLRSAAEGWTIMIQFYYTPCTKYWLSMY